MKHKNILVFNLSTYMGLPIFNKYWTIVSINPCAHSIPKNGYQCPFRPWDKKLSAKALLYHTNCNRPDIAFVVTLLAQNSATPTMPYRSQSNQISTDI